MFLFSLDLLKKNLFLIYNEKLYNLIQKTTNTKFKAFLMGIICTIVMQSSSGVTAVVISLMAAGYLGLPQALGIMIGSNIGTCISAFIITINIDFLSLYIITFFFIIYLFCRKEKTKTIMSIFICIGIVFLGLQFIESGCAALTNNINITNGISKLQNNKFVSLNFGILITILIQSSSAVIGILEQMYHTGLINITTSTTMMLGSNIGTTITGYLTLPNTNKEAKQAVHANVIFNILGAIIFYFLMTPFVYLLQIMENSYFINNIKLTVASSHLIFNLVSAFIGYIFFDQLIYIVNKNYYKKKMNYRFKSIDKI